MIENRSIPRSRVIPELVYPDLAATVAWLIVAFGFSERLRIGNHRAQLTTEGGGDLVVVQGPSDQAHDAARSDLVTHSIMVRVTDADRHHERAQSHGARILAEPTDYPFSERSTPPKTWPVIAGPSRSPSPTSRPRSGTGGSSSARR